MTYNELIGKVAGRAKVLVDESIDNLRQLISDDELGSLHAAREQTQGMSKGQLVEAILYDEFCSEFDFDIDVE